MSDAAPVPKPADPKLRVISAAQSPIVPEEPGVRPLPWPPWKGRYGSLGGTAAVAALWLLSLAAALVAKQLGTQALVSGFPGPTFLGGLAVHVPWTMAALWLLYAGFGYGVVLLLVCAAVVPEPLVGKPWFGEPFALVVFAGLAFGFPFNTRLRGLPSFGLFVLAALCAAAAAAMAGLISDNRDTLVSFERLWAGHMAQDMLVTAPLAFLVGPYVERRKRLAFGALPIPRVAVRQQILALLVALAAVTAFCITWTAAADQYLSHSIAARVTDPHVRAALEQAQRVTALRKAALVALLLGAVCSGASLIILVFRRYREELRAEVQRNTEALRRRHLQLAALQQVTESANRSLDPDTVFSEMALCMARLTDAAQVTVYMPDPQHTGYLKLIKEVCQRPPQFEHRARLPIDGSITGQSFRSGSIVTIARHLPVYIDVESVRVQFQQHDLDAFLGVPIISERAVLGVVSMTFDRSYAPDEEEHRLFRLIGHAVGAALERAETHTKARHYAGELGGLYRFSQQLAGASEEAQFLPIAAAAARRLLGAQATAIFLTPPGTPSAPLRCVACDGAPEKLAVVRDVSFTPHDSGLLAEAVRELRSVGVGVRMPAAAPQALAGAWQERSALVVPLPALASEAGPAGAFVWVFDGQVIIGLEESGLAEEVARQTLAGLRRSRLIEKTRQQAEELKLLDQIGRSLSQRLTMAHTLEQTVQNVGKIVSARWATVFVLDQATQTLRPRASSLPQPGAMAAAIPVAAPTLMAACLKESRTLVVPDVLKDPRCNPELARHFQAASALCVPLGPPAQRFGVLLLSNPTPVEFSADEVRRVEQVAQLASAAIERARLYEEACQRADDLILLNEVGHLLAESPALESTLQRIAELVCRSFQLAGAGFLLLTEQRDALVPRGLFGVHSPKLAALRLPLAARDITTQAFRQHQALVVENGATDKRVHRILRKMLPGAASGAVIPMSGPRGPVGVLGVWRSQPAAFTPRDLQCLAGVARLAAAAVGRGELVQALQASEKRLQEVVDGIHAMIISIDPQGNVQSVNATAERMFGLKHEAILGRNLAQTANLSPSEQARLRTAIRRAFTTLDCGEQLLLNWTSPEGHERKIRWRSSFLRSPEGQVTGMVCLGVDITEQVLLEAQLLQAQKMESVGALAGGLAHDFNNLLGGIIGQCALLRAQTDDGRTLGSLTHIESAAKRGADLTTQLMAFARKSVLQPRPVDIGALIKETAALLSGSLPHAIRIATTIAPALPHVHGDPTQLQQVLLNLCVNARDAMPDGGTLTIEAAPTVITAGAAQAPPGVTVDVSDTGTGMAEEAQQHLFEPFFTTKKPGKGTGLGLSVVFGIVRSHGGQIACYSQPNKGTRFSIRLPGAKPPSGAARPSSGAATISHPELAAVGAVSPLAHARSYAGHENVLLVDDDAILRETVCQLLQALGYHVRTATNGAEALKLLDTDRSFVPAIVLLDVVMPGLAGKPLYVELGKRAPATPVILMSGYSADQTVADLLDAGARELIQKPFTVDVLADAMRRALGSAPENDQPPR